MGDSDRAAALGDFLRQINETVMHFGLVDIIVVILVLIGLLRGYRKGFSILLGNLTQMVVIITVTLQYIDKLMSFVKLDSPITTNIIRASLFVAIVTLCYYITKIILTAFAKVFTIQFTDSIDKLAGAISGVIFFMLLLSFICTFVLMFSTKGLKETFEKANMSGAFLEKMAPSTHQMVMSVFAGLQGVKLETIIPRKNGAQIVQ